MLHQGQSLEFNLELSCVNNNAMFWIFFLLSFSCTDTFSAENVISEPVNIRSSRFPCLIMSMGTEEIIFLASSVSSEKDEPLKPRESNSHKANMQRHRAISLRWSITQLAPVPLLQYFSAFSIWPTHSEPNFTPHSHQHTQTVSIYPLFFSCCHLHSGSDEIMLLKFTSSSTSFWKCHVFHSTRNHQDPSFHKQTASAALPFCQHPAAKQNRGQRSGKPPADNAIKSFILPSNRRIKVSNIEAVTSLTIMWQLKNKWYHLIYTHYNSASVFWTLITLRSYASRKLILTCLKPNYFFVAPLLSLKKVKARKKITGRSLCRA